MIGKILDNGKLGKIGIQKEYDSEYLKLNHATYSSKADKENKRLLRRNEKSHLVGSPTPTQLTLGEATEPTADGAKALLDENSKDTGIIQTFIQPGSKSNSELGLPKEIIPKQTQELDKTLENRNVKPYKNKEDALVKEGYLNPTWEPQLKTIAKEHALDEAKLKEIFFRPNYQHIKGEKA